MAEPVAMADGGYGASGDGAVAGESGGGSALGMVVGVAMLLVTAVATIVSKVWHGITKDGTLAAAGRQGADELGAALKAFPDSIQTQESGTVWNPTQGEIAAGRSSGRHYTGKGYSSYYSSYSSSSQPPHPWPSEIAAMPPPAQDRDPGPDQSHDAGHSM